MNQKPYNKFLINLVCSVCTGKYFPSVFSHRPRPFVARSVRKPRAGKYFPVQTEQTWFFSTAWNMKKSWKHENIHSLATSCEIFQCHYTSNALSRVFQIKGETDECEYLKERLGDLAQHPLAAFFGLNYVETGYLVVVVLTQLLVILLTAGAMHVKMRLDRKTE